MISEFKMLSERMTEMKDGEGVEFYEFLVTKNFVNSKMEFRITEKRRVTTIKEDEILNPNKVPANEDERYKIGYIIRLLDEAIRQNKEN